MIVVVYKAGNTIIKSYFQAFNLVHFRDNTLYSLCLCVSSRIVGFRERQQEDDCRRVSLTLNIRNSPTKKTALEF